ncbi:hypothetical protein BRC91_06600 [Halobacteriales archaeon QS_4_62_28]|nr:MAG: hypothetical protein BRC91_06600 [Halobacteriales archaeon QS_4_62_28]
MGLKCSVLGHAYGETTIDRDRQEQGSEVVITIREVETCDRCGAERVVSENKEVTAIETPDDEADIDVDTDSEVPTDEPTAEPSDESAAEASEPKPNEGEELHPSDVVDGETTPSATGDVDTGAEILDAESEAPVDDEADAEEPVDDELADPSIDTGASGESVEGAEPSPEEDDAVIIDEPANEDGTEAGRQPGEWPEEPAGSENDWRPDTIGAVEENDETEQATESTTITVPDGQFRCPECGFTTLVNSSSLRRGDFCPECRRGTLVHEPEEETRKE